MTQSLSRISARILCIILSLLLCVPILGAYPQAAFAKTSAELQEEADALETKIDDLQTQINDAQAEYQAASEEHEAATAAAEAAAKRAEECRVEIEGLQIRLGDRAQEMYKSGGGVSFIEVLLGSSSFEEFITLWGAMERISQQDAAMIQEAKDLRSEAEAAEAEAKEQAEKAAAAMEAAKAAEEEIAASKKSMEAELSKMTEEIAVLQAREEQERIAAEEAARREEAANNAWTQLGNSGSSVTSSGWSHPCPGYQYVSCEFGYSPITYSHNGIDLAAAGGTPIYSAKAGTVTYVGWYGTGGNSVIVSHGSGVRTIYMHQSRTAAYVGQYVNAGDHIGYVGTTGLSTGNHLHFQIEINGYPTNPRNYIAF